MNKRIFQTVLLLMLALFGSTSLLRADELTVYDGTTTNSYVPVYGMWADAYLRCQYVMPAEDLVDMKGADINCMKFYLSQQATAAWTGTFQVYMTEVDYTSISAFIDPSTATTVYQGTLDATGSIMTVEFDSDYSYNGGNLLIGFDQIVKGNYKSAYFYGVSATGASVQGYNSSSVSSVSPTQRDFLPKTTFIYEASGTKYAISAVSNPEGVGTLTGAGQYLEGAECTLTATCPPEYYFINWTLDDVEVSSEPEYTFTVTGDATYVANFGQNASYEITVSSANNEYGTVAGGGTFYENEICVVRAAGVGNYLFTNWTVNGEVVSTQPVYSFTVTGDVALVANFAEFSTKLLYNGAVVDSWFPFPGGAFDYSYSQSQYVMPDYDLVDMVGKSIKGMKLYLSNEVNEAYYDGTTLVYLTEYATENISAFIDPNAATAVFNGMVNISQGEMTIVFDTPYDYYGGNLLIGINNVELATNAVHTYFYCIDKRDSSVYDCNETGNFTPNQRNRLPKTTFFFDGETGPIYEITATVDPEDAGTVTGTGSYSAGRTCTLTAVKEQGYSFVNWTLNGEEVSTEATYTFTVTGDAEYVAHFEEGGQSEEELTVYDGTSTNNVIPMYIFYFDSYTKSQYVIPAEDLVDIVGGEISAMKYYSSNTSNYTTGCQVDIYLKEVNYTTISAYEDKSTAQVVYTGTVSLDANKEMLITFDTPFTYFGGNLLVGTENLTTTSYSNVQFYGTTVNGASIGGQNSSGTASVPVNQTNFIPKTTFYAEVNALPIKLLVTPDPMELSYRPIGAWMKPFVAAINNQGCPVTINDLYFDNDYFQMNEVTVPFQMGMGDVLNLEINTNGVEEGEVTGTLVMNYANGKTKQVPVSAIAYVPVAGDVWENAIEVTVPFVGTAPAGIHYNYNIPGGTPEANDAVYKVNVDQLSMLNVTTGDAESTVAVYTEEGFDGVGGPDMDNTYNYELQVTTQASEFFEDFENGFPEGWNNYDLDGDNFHWQLYSEVFSTTNACHNGSQEMITSSSYDRFTNVALTPDNYLVTPLVEIADGSVFSFWACAQDANYASEHFGVAVSPDDGYYTMIQEWTLGAKSGSPMGGVDKMGNQTRGTRAMGNWYQFVVDLSAYAGEQLYIAIRHFNCTDMFYLNVDDIELSTGRGRDAAQAGVTVDVGTYYVVVASAEQEFPVNINLNTVPTPVAAQMVYPADNAMNIEAPCTLVWSLGAYTQEMQVLFGTQYPPTDVLIDWTDQLVRSATVDLEPNTMYFVQINERNSTGTTEGNIASFVSQLDVPALYADSWYAYEDEDIRIYWDTIDIEGLLSYNVYLNDSLIANTTETEYIANLEYNLSYPYIFEVSAVYELGESAKSDYVYFYVSGYGTVEGHVYEQDGTTPISGVSVMMYGYDVFDEYFWREFVTDEEGFYSGLVPVSFNSCAGHAWKVGYQAADLDWFSVPYQETVSNIDFVLNEEYKPVAEVTVEEVGSTAEVAWTLNGNRSLQYYRVYRNDAYSTTPELIADSIFETTYVDETWADLEMGSYIYGVSALYQGNLINNREDGSAVDFEEGLPEGWTILDSNGDGYTWTLTSDVPTTWTYYASYTLDWYRSGTNAICSGSYINGVGALSPDDYLVSPQTTISAGSTFSFWAAASDASYPEEHFGVFVSSNGTDNWTMLNEWTLTAKGGAVPGGRETRDGNGAKIATWYNYSVDLSAYAGQQVYIAIRHFDCSDQYILIIDDIECPDFSGGSTPTPSTPAGVHESEITWSDVIDKDMFLGAGEVSLTVTLNSGDSPDGTYVHLYSHDDNQVYCWHYLNQTIFLGETGSYTWDNFLKGNYHISINKEGYVSIDTEVAIFEPIALTFELVEQTETVSNLYVSPTGWAKWNDAQFDVAANVSTFTEGFEKGIPEDWTIIDGNKDGFPWSYIGNTYYDWNYTMGNSSWAHTGIGAALSASWIANHGAVTPNDYLVTPKVYLGNGSTLNFWAAPTDASWPYEHFGVFVSTTDLDPESFVEIQSWTLTGDAKGDAPRGSNDAKVVGTWNYYSVDLSEFAGNEAYIAFRHFDCRDWYVLSIDDVELTVNEPDRQYIDYNVVVTDLAGEEIFNDETSEKQMQLPVDDLEEGETYICKVANVYSSGLSEYIETEFVYAPCDNYEEAVVMTANTPEGNLINWNYPDGTVIHDGQWYRYDDGYGNYCIGAPNFGGNDSDEFYWGVMFPAGSYSGNMVTNVAIFNWFAMESGEILIYNGGEDAPANLVDSREISFTTSYGMVKYVYDNPVEIDPTQNVWIVVHKTSEEGYVTATCTSQTNDNARWVSLDGNTWTVSTYNDFMIRVNITDATARGILLYRDGELLGFNRYNSYLDEGQTEMHDYSVRVVYLDYAMSCEQEAVVTPRYNISVVPNFEEYGTVTGSGVYFEGMPCTIEALSADEYDYPFLYWTKNGEVVSHDAEYTFTVTEDAEYVANFMSTTNHWTADPNLYENSMTVTGIVYIDGELQATNMWEVGAFVGDECRGNDILTYTALSIGTEDVEGYFVFMTIYGEPGDELTFKLYNHVTESVEDLLCTNEMEFVADENFGTLLEPYEFNFLNVVIANYQFTPGWNWWSTHVELNAINGMEMLEEGLGADATQISSQTSFTNYYEGYGWYGSLTTINNESMYRVQMTGTTDFSMIGPKANPADHPITLTKGWNHIGYISKDEMSVDDALVNVTAQQGDMVKSQKSYANYYEGYGWYGSLNTIKPGDGLMYKSVNDASVTFTYPAAASGAKDLAENLTGDNNHWVPNVNAYPYNMTVMAIVELDGIELASDNYQVAAFANGECRGSVQVIYAEPLNRYVAFLTISGEEAAALTFGLYNMETGEECISTSSLTFNADDMVGNPDEMFVIKFRGNTALNELNGSVRLYPNPVSTGEKVQMLMSTDTQPVRIEIVDAIGKVVSVETSTTAPASINVPLTAGVYTVRIITENNGVMIQKLVVK